MKFPFAWWMVSLMILGAALTAKKLDVPVLVDLQLKIFDRYQSFAPREYEEAPVRIVDIDDVSLARLGQWPWSRTQLAELTRNLTEAGAAAVVFDVVFAESDRTSPKQVLAKWDIPEQQRNLLQQLPDHDQLFARALGDAPSVTGMVMTRVSPKQPRTKAGFSFIGDDPKPYVPNFGGAVTTLPSLVQNAKGNGALNSDPDRDGILRRIPMMFRIGNKLYPSLTGEALRVAQGASTYLIKSVGASDEISGKDSQRGITALKIGAFEIPTDLHGRVWIYFTPSLPERYIPAWNILNRKFDRSKIDGHIVLIGTTAAGLKDIRSTPLNPAVGGVEVHAQALEQMMLGIHLKRPDWIEGAELIMIAVTGLMLLVVMARLNALFGALFMFATLLGGVAFSWHMFRTELLLVEPVTLILTILLLYFSETLRRFMQVEREKSRIRGAFSHYMAPALVDQLAGDPERLKLGGENRVTTIMFTDIRDFSAISESMEPVDLTRFINRFLTPMTEEILLHRGTIDKYIGDAIMALWNAPLETDDHEIKAAQTALAMRKALVVFNDDVKDREAYQHVPLPVRMGIGINTGVCCVGNLGSTQRFDYSALGNEVDLAARLEGLCKLYGVDIIVGENTAIKLDNFAVVELDHIRVKGKQQPITIFALLDDQEMLASETYRHMIKAHQTMLQCYRKRQWAEAAQYLEQARHAAFQIPILRMSVYYRLFEERIAGFEASPPPAEWDGVFTVAEK